jgi:hypothetical protein
MKLNCDAIIMLNCYFVKRAYMWCKKEVGCLGLIRALLACTEEPLNVQYCQEDDKEIAFKPCVCGVECVYICLCVCE